MSYSEKMMQTAMKEVLASLINDQEEGLDAQEDILYEPILGNYDHLLHPCTPANLQIIINDAKKYLSKRFSKETYPEINPLADKDAADAIRFIFEEYFFVSNQIKSLVECGDGHSVNKTKFIIDEYIQYKLTGEIREIKISERKYYHPNFGKMKTWFKFIDALHKGYYNGYNQTPEFAYYIHVLSSAKQIGAVTTNG